MIKMRKRQEDNKKMSNSMKIYIRNWVIGIAALILAIVAYNVMR